MAIKKRMRRAWVMASVIGLLSGWVGTATSAVQAQLDRDQITLGERAQLKIRSQGRNLNATPDLSSLRADFYLLGQNQSIRTTIMNGQRNVSVDWLIDLTPLRPGELEIPAIQVGTESTEPLRLTVFEEGSAPTWGSANPRPDAAVPLGVTLSAEVDHLSPYVQEQVALTLRLESTHPILSGSLSEPEIPGAIIESLGEDKNQVIEREGHPVHIFERRYALFPQQSGELLIRPTVFDGEIKFDESGRNRRTDRFGDSRLDDLMGGSLFDNFFGGSGHLFDQVLGHRGQSVRAISDPVQLTIRERPDQAPGQRWLPAQDLELVEIWPNGSPNPPPFVVGEPVNRVVAVRARGVTASQLPIPEPPQAQGVKQYAEPAYEDSQEVDGGMIAVRATPTVLIPTRAGNLTLPPVEIDWWDTKTDQARTAILPARTVYVEHGSPGLDQHAATPPAPVAFEPPQTPPPTAEMTDLTPIEPGADHAAWIGLGVAGLIGLVGLLAYPYRQKSHVARTPGPLALRLQKTQLERNFKRACLSGDRIAAETTLLEIAQLIWPDKPPRSTGEIAQRADLAELDREIAHLGASRFSVSSQLDWNGTELWRAYRASELALRKPFQVNDRSSSNLLPELYPSG